MSYAGLDLSRQRLDVDVLDEGGRAVDITAVRSDTDALRTLAAHVLRHGGEAGHSRRAYVHASGHARRELIDFLNRLQLYDIESLPADINGDGKIDKRFRVQGKDTGVERFNAEWLFRTPVRIQGWVANTDGVLIRSHAAVNLVESYGLDLPYRVDGDLDGWPDVWDVAPGVTGYRDGLR